MTETIAEKPACFQLKGSLFALTTLQLLSFDLDVLAKQLAVKVEQAPKFFDHTPVVIDLVRLNSVPGELNFARLLEVLSQYHIVAVGIRGGRPEQQAAAKALHLAVLPEKKASPESETTSSDTNTDSKQSQSSSKAEDAAAPAAAEAKGRVIRHPVRSGQQIYAADGDLVILNSVSAGAEILAAGHIHVYGALRGRALAGVHGNTHAAVFCQKLEAELVSIAGHYRTSEHMRQTRWGLNAHLHLVEGEMQITALS